MTHMRDSENPSVPEAREFDEACPGGRAHYIVYFRQDKDPTVGHWILEETATGKVVDQGSLRVMLQVMTRYPHARRATWAEDMLRFRPQFLNLPFTYAGEVVPPLKFSRTYPPKDPNRKTLTDEEERQACVDFGKWYDEKYPKP